MYVDPWILLVTKWYSVNFSFFLSSLCTLRLQTELLASESLCQVTSAYWMGSQICNRNFLQGWCPFGVRLTFMVYRQMSAHQSWKSLKASGRGSSSHLACQRALYPEKVWHAQARPGAKSLAGPFKFFLVSFSAFPPLTSLSRPCPELIQVVWPEPVTLRESVRSVIIENVCVVAQQ